MSSYCIEDYVKLPVPDGVWIWDGIIPVSGSTLLHAKQKVGKSQLSIKLAEAVADPAITTYLDIPIKHHGVVLYIQLDTPRGLWKEGYIKNVKSVEARRNIYIIDKELPDIPVPFDIREKKCQLWVRQEVERVQPTLVIIDTIRRMHRGDENDPTVMSVIWDTFVDICKPAAILVLGHDKKQQAGDTGPAVARGSTALLGAVDSLIHLTKKELTIEARSDIEPRIAVYQQDDGTFTTNSKEESINEFISKLGDIPKSAVDKAIAQEFGVSLRTARRWRS